MRPVASESPPVDAARLEAHVKYLSADLHPRSHDQLRNTELAAQYIFDQLKASGAAVATQDVVVGRTTYRNIVARFGPATGPLIVVGAHYDAHAGTPGADDNASGVAGVLEAARVLAMAEHPRTLVVAFWDEEERGLVGSRAQAMRARAGE